MNTAAGFKQSDVGVIPDDWTQSTIGSHVKRLVAGVSVNSKSTEYDGDLSVPSVLKTSAVTGGKVISTECKAIADRDLSRAKTPLRANSVIISRMNTPALVGECGYAPHAAPNLYLPDRLWLAEFRQGDATSARWLAALLSSPAYAPRIKAEATGTSGTMKNIPKMPFLALPIPYPPPQEQKAIATALGNIDDLIASLDALIAKKRDLKQAAMQQLLTGRTRLPGFYDDWQSATLGSSGRFYGGLTGKSKRDFGHGTALYVPFVNVIQNTILNTENLERVNIQDGEAQNEVLYGDLLFNGSSETPEEVALTCVVQTSIPSIYLNSFCFGFRPKSAKVFHSPFWAHFFRGPLGRRVTLELAQGSTRFNISKRALAQSIIPTPSFVEQRAISKILEDMDSELAILCKKRSKTLSIREGMIQQLLTGRVRLA